jgi:hypothetical protein
MATEPSQTVRLWRRAPWSHSPLMRRTDRIESSLLLVVVMFVLMMVPLTAAYGTITYGELVEQSRLDRQTGHQVEATVLRTAPEAAAAQQNTEAPPPSGNIDARRWVGWTQDGQTRTARWEPAAGVRPGETIDLWVDRTGAPVAPPLTGADSAATAVIAALTMWLLMATAAAAGLYGLHRWAEHHRRAAWESEWRGLDTTPGWTA